MIDSMNLLLRNKEQIKVKLTREEFVTRIQELYQSRKSWKEEKIELIDSTDQTAELTIAKSKGKREFQISAFIQYKWEDGETFVDVEYNLHPPMVNILLNLTVVANLTFATLIFIMGEMELLDQGSQLLNNIYFFVFAPLLFWVMVQIGVSSNINKMSELLRKTLS